jgi:hypothetical protein
MIEPQDLRIYRLHPEGLDPITVYVEQFRPGASRMTVQCYAQAWTVYWGSHGDCPLEEFVCSSSAEHIADGLTWGNGGLILKRREKDHHAYVVRIARAIKAKFREMEAA